MTAHLRKRAPYKTVGLRGRFAGRAPVPATLPQMHAAVIDEAAARNPAPKRKKARR